jgi:KEOPS complex subunit Pcc1
LEVEGMKANAVVRLTLPSKKHLKILSEALMPEIKKPATVRSKTSLEKNRRFLILNIEAKDTVALRATLNAYLRWVNATINVLQALENIS